jgi:hypothetical protein
MKKGFLVVMGFGNNTHMKNKLACEKKWSIMYYNLKKIQEYMLGTSHNEFLKHVYSRKNGNVEFTLVVQHKHL